MRKSPLSAPGGNYGHKNRYRGYFRNFRQGNRDEGSDGYSGDVQQRQGNNDNQQGAFSASGNNQSSPQNLGNDFIPLGFSSPVNHKSNFYSPNYRGRGNISHGFHNSGPSPGSRGGNGGFSHPYQNNFHHDQQNRNSNDQNSHKLFHKQQYGMRRAPRGKNTRRNVDISRYIHLESMLEDPWIHLMEKYMKTADVSEEDKSEACDNESGEKSSCTSIPVGDVSDKFESPNLKSESLATQKNEDNKLLEPSITLNTES